MSFANQTQTAESADSAANNDDDDDFTPQPVTSRYLSLQAHRGLLMDAIGAVEDFSMDDTDLPAVKWANAIQDALYNRDGCLGSIQKETSYTTSDFKEQHGDAITTPHGDLTDGERAELKTLLKDAGKDVSGLDSEFKLPIVNDERLPLLVADEDVLEDALEMLEAILAEFDNDASGTTDAVDDDDDDEGFTGWDAPMIGDGMPSPDAFTVAELENDVLPYVSSPENCRLLLRAEERGKDRVTAIDAIEDRGDELHEQDYDWRIHVSERSTTDETDADDDDDDTASGTTGGMSEEEKADLAETVATAAAQAVVEALDN